MATPVRFSAELVSIEDTTLLLVPSAASKGLPSRGQVSVQGTIEGHEFATVVEPDGRGGHWIRVDPELRRAAGLELGDVAEVVVEPTKTWPEPDVPPDLAAALAGAPDRIQEIWDDITPMARWEWVRWVQATQNPDTRQRRVEVSLSKMDHGKRRPCCFNLAACTAPELAKSGRLIAVNTR